MPYKLIIKADAYEDIVEAFAFYESKSHGLGDQFWNELQAFFDKIEKHPTHYGYSDELPEMIFRDVMMEKFPIKSIMKYWGLRLSF